MPFPGAGEQQPMQSIMPTGGEGLQPQQAQLNAGAMSGPGGAGGAATAMGAQQAMPPEAQQPTAGDPNAQPGATPQPMQPQAPPDLGGQQMQPGWQPGAGGQILYPDGQGPVTSQVPKLAQSGFLPRETARRKLAAMARYVQSPTAPGGLLGMKSAFDAMGSMALQRVARKTGKGGEAASDPEADMTALENASVPAAKVAEIILKLAEGELDWWDNIPNPQQDQQAQALTGRMGQSLPPGVDPNTLALARQFMEPMAEEQGGGDPANSPELISMMQQLLGGQSGMQPGAVTPDRADTVRDAVTGINDDPTNALSLSTTEGNAMGDQGDNDTPMMGEIPEGGTSDTGGQAGGRGDAYGGDGAFAAGPEAQQQRRGGGLLDEHMQPDPSMFDQQPDTVGMAADMAPGIEEDFSGMMDATRPQPEGPPPPMQRNYPEPQPQMPNQAPPQMTRTPSDARAGAPIGADPAPIPMQEIQQSYAPAPTAPPPPQQGGYGQQVAYQPPQPPPTQQPYTPPPRTRWQEMSYEDLPASAYSSSGDLQRQMGASARRNYAERIKHTNEADRQYAQWRRSGAGGQRPDNTMPVGPGSHSGQFGAPRDWVGPADAPPMPNMQARWGQVPDEAQPQPAGGYEQPPQQGGMVAQAPPKSPSQDPFNQVQSPGGPSQPQFRPRTPPQPQGPPMAQAPPQQASYLQGQQVGMQLQPPKQQPPVTVGRTTQGMQMPKAQGNAAMGSRSTPMGGGFQMAPPISPGGMGGAGMTGMGGGFKASFDLGKVAANIIDNVGNN